MGVILGEVSKIDIGGRRGIAEGIQFSYDYLIVAAGACHSYFGRDEWEKKVPGLKILQGSSFSRHGSAMGVARRPIWSTFTFPQNVHIPTIQFCILSP